MKKSSVLMAITGLALTGAAIVIAIKINKKQEQREKEEREEKKKEEIQDLSDLKVPEETLISIIENEKDSGFVTKLHKILTHSPKWDDGQLDAERYLQGEEAVVHISQSLYKNQPQIDFYVTVPNYVKRSYAFPKIQDFKEALNGVSKELYILGAPRPFITLEAWMIIETEGGEQKIMRVNPEYYASKKDEHSDGTKAFYEGFIRDSSEKEKENLEEYLQSRIEKGITVKEVFLFWRVSFRIKTPTNKEGITLSQAASISRLFLDMEVGKDNIINYELLVFHTPTPNPEFLDRSCMSTEILDLKGSKIEVEY